MPQLQSVEIPTPHGFLEGLLRMPDSLPTGDRPPRMAAVMCHPHPVYGGTMHTKAVFRIAQALVDLGFPTLRFNFRGVGRSTSSYDHGRGERDDVRAALDYLASLFQDVPLALGGFSFGSWVALEVGATDDRVSALIGIAPPVATSISGHNYTFENTLASTKPKFFVQGEADEVCPLEGMWAFYAKLPEPKELVVIDAANHLFEGQAAEAGEALEDLLGDYEG